MLKRNRAIQLMWFGGAGLVFGTVAPFLMMIRVWEPSLWLSFLSYITSVGGLFLGLIGLAGVAPTPGQAARERDDDRQSVPIPGLREEELAAWRS